MSSSDDMFALALPGLSHRLGNVLVSVSGVLCLPLLSPIAVRNVGSIPCSRQPHSSGSVLLPLPETPCAGLGWQRADPAACAHVHGAGPKPAGSL